MSWQMLLKVFRLWSRIQCWLSCYYSSSWYSLLHVSVGEVSWLCLRWLVLMQGRNLLVLCIKVYFLSLCQFWILMVFLLPWRNTCNSLSCPFSQGLFYPKIMLCHCCLTVFLPSVACTLHNVSMPSWHSCSEGFAFCAGLVSVLPQAYHISVFSNRSLFNSFLIFFCDFLP